LAFRIGPDCVEPAVAIERGKGPVQLGYVPSDATGWRRECASIDRHPHDKTIN
jgi:hypothetical protein